MGSPQDKGPLKTFLPIRLISVHIVLWSICTAYEYINSFRVLYEHLLPRTLRTLLNTPYTPYTPNTPNTPNIFKRVKHFEPLGLLYELKEIDFNALQCVER